MENYNANYTTIETNTLNTTKTFMASVFAWMSLALTITAITSYLFGTNIELLRLLVSETGGFSIFGWVVLLAPIGFVLWHTPYLPV
jgi:FtsH-binding integral membrane protein